MKGAILEETELLFSAASSACSRSFFSTTKLAKSKLVKG